ncbi:MAG TPA: PilZ domain-containing protein [Pyrinomonadaceae bacterium]|nr:PilZ domain-containing protein [Pyrinomonadaceae bacterium]
MNDARKKTRFLSELSCAFGPTPDAPRSGTITSIGLKECFVKTKAIVIEGQNLHVRVWTPENRWLRLRGRVKYHMEGVGFGVVFQDLTEDQLADLARLVEQLRRAHLVEQQEDTAADVPADVTTVN